MIWIILVYYIILTIIIGTLVYYFDSSNTKTFYKKKNICLLIAHPDDECMFFGPVLRYFSKNLSNAHLHILCMTNGNHYGIGNQRELELNKSCSTLIGPKYKLTIVNESKLPDDPKIEWDQQLCLQIVNKYLIENQIDILITFDKYGQKPISFDDYEGSEFEYNPNETNEAKLKKQETKKYDIITSTSTEEVPTTSKGLPSKNVFRDAQSREEGHVRAYHFASMNAYSKHKKLVNDYLRYYSGGKTLEEVFKRDTSKDKTDIDVIREEMKFIWDEDEDKVDTWGKRLAKRYYDKLFKEYCICDLTFYKQNKIAMRWRVEKEVFEGKGQFICGDKRCTIRDGLKSWEVNFAYMEHGEKKNALVKLRLCPDCSYKLNYHHKKKEVTKVVKTKEVEQEKNDLKRKDSSTSSSSSSSDEEESPSKCKKQKTNEEKLMSKTKKEELTKDGNIVMAGDDSLWKTKPSESASALVDEKRHREDEFESYLEDLLL